MTFSRNDILRIIAIVAGFGGSDVAGMLAPLFKDFYIPNEVGTHIVSFILGLIGVASLVNLIISKAVPAGYNTVITPTSDPNSVTALTTKASLITPPTVTKGPS